MQCQFATSMTTAHGHNGPSEVRVDVPQLPRGTAGGTLRWSPEGPLLTTASGQAVRHAAQEVTYALHERILITKPGVSEANPLSKPVIVKMSPIFMTLRPYSSRIVRAIEDIYPPSSHHWKFRVVREGADAVFAVQEIEGSEFCWLTVFDPDAGLMFESHEIRRYELWFLAVREDWEVDQETELAVGPSSPEEARLETLRILDGPPPSWKSIAALTQGVAIPGLRRGKTMRELMDQLVPQSFPPEVREELMVFLAWVTKNKTPNKDPIDFFQDLTPMATLRKLCGGHFRCMLDGVTYPPYVKILRLAASGHLSMPRRAPPVAVGASPWLVAWYKLTEQFPDWKSRIIGFANELNKSGAVAARLPVSRVEARSSAKAWSDRLAMLTHGLLLRAYVDPRPLGLRHAIYIGRAYGWPHKHLAWSARLDSPGGNYPRVDLMVMPPAASERVRRQRNNVIETEWSARSINLGLFDVRNGQWRMSVKRVVNSVEGSGSLQKLKREFGGWLGASIQPTSETEAKVLDAASGDTYLTLCESDRYWSHIGLNRREFQSSLASLRDRGVVRLQYGTVMEGVATVFIMTQGSQENVCSLARSLLLHTPSTLVEIADSGRTCLALSRIPERSVHELTTSMEDAMSQSEARLSCSRVVSYTSYMRSLYRRLLKPDSTWDDDVSVMLSQ